MVLQTALFVSKALLVASIISQCILTCYLEHTYTYSIHMLTHIHLDLFVYVCCLIELVQIYLTQSQSTASLQDQLRRCPADLTSVCLYFCRAYFEPQIYLHPIINSRNYPYLLATLPTSYNFTTYITIGNSIIYLLHCSIFHQFLRASSIDLKIL